MVIKVLLEDLLSQHVDAIVNPANKYLKHGGGVAGLIVRRGGRIIQEESDKLAPIEVGSAVITTAGALPAKYVIHAVGPRMGEGNEDEKLANAFVSVFKVAEENNIKTIAMPAISTGIFGYPVDRCATIAGKVLKRVIELGTTVREVRFCFIEENKFRVFQEEFTRQGLL